MIVMFYNEEIIDDKRIDNESSIYLAGPTRWNQHLVSWRKEAIEILKLLEYDGFVYAPEYSIDKFEENYKEMASWRKEKLQIATTIVFWVPKNYPISNCSNAEFAYWLAKRKEDFIYGREVVNSNYKERMYLDWLYEEEKRSRPFDMLEELLKEAVINATELKIK